MIDNVVSGEASHTGNKGSIPLGVAHKRKGESLASSFFVCIPPNLSTPPLNPLGLNNFPRTLIFQYNPVTLQTKKTFEWAQFICYPNIYAATEEKQKNKSVPFFVKTI